MKEIIKIFKALSDETRIRIMKILGEKSLCVCELTEILGIRQPTVSHHLKILEEAGLLQHKRNGQWINYELANEKEKNYVPEMLNFFSGGIENDLTIKSDIETLRVVNRNTTSSNK